MMATFRPTDDPYDWVGEISDEDAEHLPSWAIYLGDG
jgi:hypothetical protein